MIRANTQKENQYAFTGRIFPLNVNHLRKRHNFKIKT